MRPLNLGETLDASLKIVRARWRTLVTVMLVIALPVQIASVAIISATTDVYQVGGTGLGTDAASQTSYGNDGAYVAGQTVILALALLSYLLGTVACYRAVSDTYLGRPTSWRASLAYATERLGATLWLTIILVAGLAAGFIALVLPGVWLFIAWSVAYPVMLVEGTGGVTALRRSFRLTEGRWWATFGRVAAAYIMVAVVAGVAGSAFVGVADALTDDTSFAALVLERAGDLLVSVVTTPFLAAVTTLVYFDLRARKEGARAAPPAPAGPSEPFGPPAPAEP